LFTVVRILGEQTCRTAKALSGLPYLFIHFVAYFPLTSPLYVIQFGFRVYNVKEIRSLASTPPTHLYGVALRESERAVFKFIFTLNFI
jgi:hypothetical protein